jgi:hypothetical protein
MPLCTVRNEDSPPVLKLLRQPCLEVLRLAELAFDNDFYLNSKTGKVFDA